VRLNRGAACPVDGRPRAGALLALLASLALVVLGLGPAPDGRAHAADLRAALLADRSASHAGQPGPAGVDARPDPSGPGRHCPAGAGAAGSSSMDGPESALLVRAAGTATAPAPSAPVAGLGAGSVPLVAPHLLATPQARPPNTPPAVRACGAVGSRAPPGPAGA
jgi:hypothetical protein